MGYRGGGRAKAEALDDERAGMDVLGRAQAGDERAFLALYRAAQPGLLRYLAVIVGDAAEELAAQTWHEVARDLAEFPGSLEGFRTWVAGIGRRLALDHLDAVRSAVALPPGPVVPPIPERTARALRMIGRLPEPQAEAVALRAVVGLDAESAAQVLGVRPGVLRRAARKGLQALSRRLDSSAQTLPQEVDLREAPAAPALRTLRVVAESPGDPAAQRIQTSPRTAAPGADPGPRVLRHDRTPSVGLEVSR